MIEKVFSRMMSLRLRKYHGQSVTEYCIFFAAVAAVLIVAFLPNGRFYGAVKGLFETLRGRMQTGLWTGF